MFANCKKLVSIDFSNFYINDIKKMDRLFYNCKNIETIRKINNLDTKNVKSIDYLFFNNENFHLKLHYDWPYNFNEDFSKLNFSNIESIKYIFFNCQYIKKNKISRV